MKQALRLFLLVPGLIVATIVAIVLYVQFSYTRFIVSDAQKIEPAQVAIVLGASVTRAGVASDALRDRVETAIDLYRAGKVKKILMSGDDGAYHANEVASMSKLAADAGVSSTDVLVDGHGYRTYESCKRAAEVYQIHQAVIVTQRFHLGRALYLCEHFGITSQGMVADRQSYQRILFFTARDLLASVKAWWDVNIYPPTSPVGSD